MTLHTGMQMVAPKVAGASKGPGWVVLL